MYLWGLLLINSPFTVASNLNPMLSCYRHNVLVHLNVVLSLEWEIKNIFTNLKLYLLLMCALNYFNL